MSKEITDEICSSLISSIDQLDELISSEESADLFDVKTDVDAAESYNELKRLRRSLDQYSQKVGGLLYIGFIGHFSAGKSSTINSILREVGADGDRLTGLHPTDKSVTLITDTDNSNRLIGMHRRGDLDVGVVLKKSDYLKNTVIVDTPGSGDPFIIKEMVRDFLPICDVVIYVINSVNPLDTSDLPILEKAHTELPFIPVKFIVTRANEFIKNSNLPFSHDNFDKSKVDLFVSELISRLSASIPGLAVREEDILLIDNITGFGVNSIMEFLKDSSQSIGQSQLHSHKISYYFKSAQRLKKYFYNNIVEKSDSLDKLLEIAKKNHENYQQKINITNSKLTEDWTKKRNNLVVLKNETISWCGEIKLKNILPNELSHSEVSKEGDVYISKVVNDYSESFSGSMSKSVKSYLSKIHGQQKELFDESLEKLNSQNLEGYLKILAASFNANIDIKFTKSAIPESLSSYIVNGIEDKEKWVKSTYWDLSDNINKLDKKVDKKEVIIKTQEIYDDSVYRLSTMLEDFLQSIKLYRSGILALNARELAEKVGIVRAIDELSNIDAEQEKKESWENSLTQELYPDFNKLRAKFELGMTGIKQRIQEIKSSENFTLENIGKNQQFPFQK